MHQGKRGANGLGRNLITQIKKLKNTDHPMYKLKFRNDDESFLNLCRPDKDMERDYEEEEQSYYHEPQYFTCDEEVETKLRELMDENERQRREMKRLEEELQSLRAENDGYKEEYSKLLKTHEALKQQSRKDLEDMQEKQCVLEERLEKEKGEKAKCKDQMERMAEAKRNDEAERMTEANRSEEMQVREPSPQELARYKSSFALRIIDRTQVYIIDEECPKDKVDFLKDLYHNLFEDLECSKISRKINRMKRKPVSPPSSQNVFQNGAIRLGNGANAVIGGVQTMKNEEPL